MSAEAELNALKKLESNKSCVNCDAYNKFGHGNVCEKFKTFVCSNCKSAHQSYSHRVKSVTMSNWTKDEVDALRDANGGGNAAAKRVWLGRWDDAKLRKPTEGDHMDHYKRFIDKVYNDKAYYDENGSDSSNTTAASSASRSQNGGGGNLLDFSSPTNAPAPTFDAFSSSSAASSAPANDGWGAFASGPAPGASNGGFDGFGDFASAPAAPVAAAPAPAAASFDPFGMSNAVAAPPAPVASTPAASFDPFGASSSVPASASFDPFGPSSLNTQHTQPAPQANAGLFGMHTQQAVPMGMASNTGNFSAFDALAGPAPGMGMNNGMGMNMGMHGGMARGPNMMHGGHISMNNGMNMNMGMGMGMATGIGGPRPMMGGGNTYMAPPQNNGGAYGNAYGRPGGNRDPFAGLGLPGK
ncbi:hypothetical protein Poli38472_010027 [Pythium oligandrum]|uniref:Arf-GAP domain-containing protein n=1 Tax=Pythium oligandrum TaxID=41045 RepID=A0A8K1FH65_PYTOL|nr:hypothetical protein Poli38472_010027 [Pythium oligandrum]|eukprot:TMW58468.1 hypothetical protein Poli38472_010027 [Pythium oligandrum]